MKKIILVFSLISFAFVFNADAGYYRTKSPITGRYQSTGRVNSMGTHRAPAGYHTGAWGQVKRNGSLF